VTEQALLLGVADLVSDRDNTSGAGKNVVAIMLVVMWERVRMLVD